MLNALQTNSKNYTLSTFPSSNRNFEDSRKVLAISASEIYSSALPAQAYKMVITTVCVRVCVCVQIDNVFVICDVMSISVCR